MTMTQTVERKLTGRHVLFILLAFFSVLFVVNFIFVYLAVTSFSGEDTPKSYRQGIEYNSTIQSRASQAELNWDVKANHIALSDGKTRIIVEFTNAKNRPVSDLALSGLLRHPTFKSHDQAITLDHIGSGRYDASVDLPKGQWRLQVDAIDQNHRSFKFAHEIWVN